MSSKLRTVAASLRGAADPTTVGTLAAGVFAQLGLVISGVITARLLGPGDRGHLATFQAIAVAGANLLALGLPIAISFSIARNTASTRAVLRALRRVFAIQFLLTLTLTALLLAVMFGSDSDELRLSALLALPFPAAMLVGLLVGGVLQGLQRFLQLVLYRTLPIAFYAGGVVVLWLAGAAQLPEFVALNTLVYSGFAIAGIALVRRTLPPADGSTVETRSIVGYGAKGQIGQMAPLETFQLDVLAVGALGGPVVLGYYVGAMAFTNLPRFVALSIGTVVFPRVAASSTAHEARRRAFDAVLLTGVVAVAVIVPLELLVGWLIPFLFGSEFEPSVAVARVLLVSALFLSMRRVLGDVLRGVGDPIPATVAEIVSWVVYVALLVPLVDSDAARGGALAMTISAGVSFVLLAAFGVRRLMRLSDDDVATLAEDPDEVESELIEIATKDEV